MRWTAWMRVEDVGEGPAPVDVLLRAEANQTVRLGPNQGTGTEHETYELVWYEAGKGASAVEVRMTLNYEPTFSVGDRILVEFAPPLEYSAGGP
jgi:hypothetical protein